MHGFSNSSDVRRWYQETSVATKATLTTYVPSDDEDNDITPLKSNKSKRSRGDKISHVEAMKAAKQKRISLKHKDKFKDSSNIIINGPDMNSKFESARIEDMIKSQGFKTEELKIKNVELESKKAVNDSIINKNLLEAESQKIDNATKYAEAMMKILEIRKDAIANKLVPEDADLETLFPFPPNPNDSSSQNNGD